MLGGDAPNYSANPNKAEGNTKIDLLAYRNDYESAIKEIDLQLSSTSDIKQKSALLLKKAQMLSSQKKNEEALTAYQRLIVFNTTNNYPSNNLSHLYTEKARLCMLADKVDEARTARDEALRLNPNNAIAKRIVIPDDQTDKDYIKDDKTDSNNSIISVIPFVNQSFVDDDISLFKYTNPEIITLNGAVSQDVAYKLFEDASGSEDALRYLEAAKALSALPVGSYDSQDLEYAKINYLVYKAKSLYGSFQKIISEVKDINDISEKQMTRLKDSSVCYHIECATYLMNDSVEQAITIFEDALRLELSFYAFFRYHSKDDSLHILSENKIITECLNRYSKDYSILLLQTISRISATYSDIWNVLITQGGINTEIENFFDSNPQMKSEYLQSEASAKAQSIGVNEPHFFYRFVQWKTNYVLIYFKRYTKIKNSSIDVFALAELEKRAKALKRNRFIKCISSTDLETICQINKFLSILSMYQPRTGSQRIDVLNNAMSVLTEIVSWNTSTTTNLGRFFFTPLLIKWSDYLKGLSKKTEPKKDCFFSLSFDPPIFVEEADTILISTVLYNNSDYISEGFRLAVWTNQQREAAEVKNSDTEIYPGNSVTVKFSIDKKKWGISNTYEVEYALCSRYLTRWSKDSFGAITLGRKRDVSFGLSDIKWKDQGKVARELFKGRDGIVQQLTDHYCSVERYNSYVLYGLSRTGKSCILDYLKISISGKTIASNGREQMICPILIDLGAVHGISHSYKTFWSKFFKCCSHETTFFIKTHKLPIEFDCSLCSDFEELITLYESHNIHPLFMLDEFSYVKHIIDDGYMNVAFLQYMRKLAADDDLASFIFAGTYDIKELIHDAKYNISGAFNYLKEPKNPVFEISHKAAEELINVMSDKLTFTDAAIRELHYLTGDVPYWIQKLCLSCAYFAIENNTADIGLPELEQVVKLLTGEKIVVGKTSSIIRMQSTIFDKTQTLSSDPKEVKLVLTSIAFLTMRDKSKIGITHAQMQALWQEYDFDDSKYNVSTAIGLLLDRRTLLHTEQDERHYYRFSLELFRRWWSVNHSDIGLELSSFTK